jgi:hypothetical protein
MLSARVNACLSQSWWIFTASLLLTACGGGGGSTSTGAQVLAPPARAAGDPRGVSGTASNINGAGLVLQINGGNDVSIPAGAQAFSFSTLPEGSEYRVSIKSQPSGQACTLLRGAGIVGPADITDVTLDCIDNVTDALAGTYVLVSDSYRDFVTFNADGTFVAGTHEEDPSCGSSNGNGIEYGVYNWDADTGNFLVVHAALDTNGVCGFFDQNDPESVVGILRAPDGSLSLIDPQDVGGAEKFTLKPVASALATLIGSFGNAGSPDFAVFSSDGSYFIATTQADPVSGTTVGIEEACFTAGTSVGAPSGNIQTDNESCALLLSSIDTNGTAGLSNAQTTPYTIVDANTLTFGSGADASTVTRFLPNSVGSRDRNNILAGTYFSDLGAGKRDYITFYADGTFVLGTHEDDQTCGPSLGNGVEYGVYQWDRASGAFQVLNAAVDTNDSCGLVDSGQGAQGTLTKSSNGFTFTDNTGPTTFTAVLPVLGNPLLGSSTFPSPETQQLSGPDFVVFTNDGRYFQASVSADESSQPTFVAGVEDGCFTDGGTALVVDVSSSCLGAIDTNDTAGFSSAQAIAIPYQVSGADTLAVPGGQLTRMFPNSLDALTGTYAIDGKRAFITFYDDGAFAIGAHNSDPRQSQDIPDDVEFGVYSWNRATGDFSLLAKALDTNNDSSILNVTPDTLTASVDGTLTLANEVGLDLLTPVESTPGALIGSFFYAGQSPRSVVVLASDGSYFLMDLAVDPESDNIGIEEGCYAVLADSTATGSFSASRSRCLAVADGLGTLDTNGTQGFPEDVPGTYLRLDPNTLQLRFDFGGVIVGGI